MLEVVYFPIEATITFPEMAGKPSGTIKLSQASAADYMTRNRTQIRTPYEPEPEPEREPEPLSELEPGAYPNDLNSNVPSVPRPQPHPQPQR
jgi:hypothetical protein